MQDERYQVTWLVRRLFRAMAHDAEARLAEVAISAADRAVMEFLYREAPLAVPEIAARYRVSRQHVQVTANRLAEKGLVRTIENPRHRRSRLLELTGRGKKLFTRILADDRKAIDRLFADISERNVRVTRRTLETLYEQLDREATGQ